MHYYRLFEDKKEYEALGYGPQGNRWNDDKVPLIYCCNVRSLAFFELYCVLGSKVSKTRFKLAQIDIGVNVPAIEVDDLPEDWRNRPHPRSTKEFGTYWAKSKQSLCVKVPSARMPLSCFPQEHNLLINPFHPEFQTGINVIAVEKVNFELNAVAK